ncbi:MAG: energy-coupling factor transporter transmembrane protein EcfT [Clostridia bacterium]|nr:energy-coupling factor transporter transmembrane protein EcfT [Clostridia bacterium]
MPEGWTFGQYVPGRSPLHALDPRLKVVLTLTLMALCFAASDTRTYGALGLVVAGGAVLAGVGWRGVWAGLRPVLAVVALTAALNALFTPGEAVFRLGPATVSREGTILAAQMSLRLLLLVSTGLLLTWTTSPIELTDAVEALLRPFRRLGLPSHELALMMTIAIRFVPLLAGEAERLAKAQAARGADLDRGGLWRRWRALVPLLVPLLLSALRRADDLAVAMEARCYRGEGRRRYREYRLAARDIVASAVVAALAAAVAALRGVV